MAESKPTTAALNGATPPPPVNKVAVQLTKLRDANVKYKNLLKKAKERIEQQEEELTKLRGKMFRSESFMLYPLVFAKPTKSE